MIFSLIQEILNGNNFKQEQKNMFSLILLALRIFLIGAEVSVAYTSSKLITKHIDLFAAMTYNGV